MITFDRLRLAIPSAYVTILDPSSFFRTITKDGAEVRMKYEQKEPFYYLVLADLARQVTYIEFSGKVLLENYPYLISAANIDECLNNINSNKICFIDIANAKTTATVCQCDVTADILYTGSFRELLTYATIKNNRQYSITAVTTNRFAIQNTVMTNRKRERLIIYDKAAEMRRKTNEPFLHTVANAAEQQQYFSDKIRCELNLNSMDRIRKYLGVTHTSLISVLASSSDPIGAFLSNAMAPDVSIENIVHHTPRLRNLEHLLLLCLCDFNLKRLEAVIRDTTGANNSITNTIKPFLRLYHTIAPDVQSPLADTDFLHLREMLSHAISRCLPSSVTETSLLTIYRQSQNVWHPVIGSIDYFNIPYVMLPYLPEAS